ncbi:MAG TPA: hypothetical protein VLZ77_14035, partial [Acidimicrobiales bacterium]|nr:hypothetical protein [Acidimicrobiales bacterium]
MSFIWMRARAELRTTWRTTVVLALVLGLGGGAALAALAGARRTSGALPRFVAYSLPDTGGFLYGNHSVPPPEPSVPADSTALPPLARRIVSLPDVVGYFRAPYLFVGTRPGARRPGDLNVVGIADADMFRALDRPLVLAGHLPDPGQPFEAMVNELAATQKHLHVGSRVRLYSYSRAQIQSGTLTAAVERVSRPLGPAFTVRVAAVVRFPQDVNAVAATADRSGASYEGEQNMYVTPAFLPRLAKGVGLPALQLPAINLLGVRLRHGQADWPRFSSAALALGHGEVFTSFGNVYDVQTSAASAQRGIRLVVAALVIFGAMTALVTIALVDQALVRQAALEREDNDRLRMLGAARRQL